MSRPTAARKKGLRHGVSMTRSKLMKAKAKLNVLRLFGGKPVGAPGNVAEAMSNALQQELDKSADLYAVDVAKWVQVFWEDPVLERRVHAISEIGWAVYLCGEPLQSQVGHEGFLEAVFKLARTMCTQPVAASLRTTILHAVALMVRDTSQFQERAYRAGILSMASNYLTDLSASVRKSSASLLFVMFVGHTGSLLEACSMLELQNGLREVAMEDWTTENFSCNEAEQALLLLALAERAASSDGQPRVDRDL